MEIVMALQYSCKGGEIVFTGTPKQMLENGTTITAKYLRK